MSMRFLQVLISSLLLALAGCSDPDSRVSEGGIGGSGDGNVAEGGIGGSGSGTTTGYGSIYINDARHYQIAEDALVYLDGELINPATINPVGAGLPLGLVAEFLLGEDVNEELTSGTVIKMEANHQVIGPVTSLDPLEVLHQPVRTTATTQIVNTDLQTLQLGDELQVAGLREPSGTLRASRVAAPATVAHWQLIGRISEFSDDSFRIGEQLIERAGSPHIDCQDPLANGRKVLLRAQPQPDFNEGDALTGLLSIRCLSEGLNTFDAELPAELPATTDGFITGLNLLGGTLIGVDLDGQQVDLSNLLPALLSTVSGLDLGSHIEVDGILDTETGVLTARRLILRDELSLFRLIAPVAALQDGTLSVLGQEVLGLPQLSGDLFDGLSTGDTVELLGFISNGVLYAFKVTETAPQPVSLQGVISDINADAGHVLIAGIPFLLESADSISLLGEDGLLSSLVEVVDGVICGVLLPFLCPQEDQPPVVSDQLVGMLAEVSETALIGEILQGGDLILTNPAP